MNAPVIRMLKAPRGRTRGSFMLLVSALLCVSLGTPEVSHARSTPKPSIAARGMQPTRPTNHLILVSIDGLRADAIRHFDAQTLLDLMRNGSYALSATTVLPSKTLPAHLSMMTGVEPPVHGVVWNEAPSLLSRIGHDDDPIRQQYMRYFKMGDGAFYVFYTPMPHLEAPLTAARAVLFQDASITPRGRPVADVLTSAKRDLKAGEVLDGIGGFTCYGVLDNADACAREHLLPMGLAEGCRLRRDVDRDDIIAVEDVELPANRLCDALRAEQDRRFGTAAVPQLSIR